MGRYLTKFRRTVDEKTGLFVEELARTVKAGHDLGPSTAPPAEGHTRPQGKANLVPPGGDRACPWRCLRPLVADCGVPARRVGDRACPRHAGPSRMDRPAGLARPAQGRVLLVRPV